LQYGLRGLEIQRPDLSLKEKPFSIDFQSTRLKQRCKGATNELVVRAAGKITDGQNIVYDFTCGLGRDSMLLASAGFKVHMIERNPVLYLLLNDALERLRTENASLAKNLILSEADATTFVNKDEKPHIVYLDPMYPTNQIGSRANVKKDTQLLHNLLTKDEGSNESNNKLLFENAVAQAICKVVVKRPLNSESLINAIPHSTLKGDGLHINATMYLQLTVPCRK
jgi:16S rRNA (guanine1516-N2)-methyltransferase